MARRSLSFEEIEGYRVVQLDQLRRQILAGEDTGAIRRSLADLDEQEVEANALADQAAAADDNAFVARAGEIAAAAGERVAAALFGLSAPEMPA